jgi:hypothetical protein
VWKNKGGRYARSRQTSHGCRRGDTIVNFLIGCGQVGYEKSAQQVGVHSAAVYLLRRCPRKLSSSDAFLSYTEPKVQGCVEAEMESPRSSTVTISNVIAPVCCAVIDL